MASFVEHINILRNPSSYTNHFLFSNLSVFRLFYHTAHKLEGIIFVEQASPESKY